ECEVVDPRTVSPLDTETICRSVRRNHHLVVVDEANPRCGFAGDVASVVAEQAFDALRGPVRMVTSPHVPTPFNPALEDAYVPSADDIAAAVRDTVRWSHSKLAEQEQV
ncbi:MAG TPA: transketolase C-terminal domain-containing protein, partial [Pseudonocardiaceae bacterium]